MGIQPTDNVPGIAATALLAAALLVLPAPMAKAVVVCTEPLEPICVGNEETYRSEPLVERCEADVEKFIEETEEYITCLEGQTKAKREEAAKLAAGFRERVNRNQN